MTGNLSFGDDDKAIFGAGSDLQIYHDATAGNSYIDDTGTGWLYLRADERVIVASQSSGNVSAKFFTNAQAELAYNNNTKLATTSTGVDVTGTVAATAFTGDGSALTGIDSLPSQSGNSGKYLTTNGTSASWATLTVPDEVVISSTAPSSPTNGILWFDSSINCLKLYSGGWLALQTIPTLNSISGGINSGSSTDLTLSVTDATSTVSIEFYDGSTLVSTVTGVSVSGGSATVTVPSAVYSLSIGTTVSINIVNSDNVKSNSVDEDVFDPPIVGGTESISGGYKYHAFTSSGTLTVPSSQSNVEVLIVGGGGSGGTGSYGVGANSNGAGGGAGGVQNLTSQTLSTGSYSITVGAGASGVAPQNNAGNNGSSSSALGTTAGGGNKNSGLTGGSSGTPQSNSGGGGGSYSGGGGGGAGGTGVGGGGNTSKLGGAGSYYGSFTSWGAAAQSTATTTPSPNGYFAGGGAGAGASAVGRASGGGGSSSTNSASSGSGIHAGFANTGGGGGGGYAQSSYSGNGGSGIVIFRYPV
jgi:hypothetical protein